MSALTGLNANIARLSASESDTVDDNIIIVEVESTETNGTGCKSVNTVCGSDSKTISAHSSSKSSGTIKNNDSVSLNQRVDAPTFKYSLHNVSVKDFIDPFGPYQIQERINSVVKHWHNVKPQAPTSFLQKLIVYRGYNGEPIPAMQSEFKKTPSQKQLLDYDSELVLAVRNSDLPKLKKLHDDGFSMAACNKFGESIVHMACRRASFEVVDFILKNGGSSWIVDDFGRTPLHDACWRSEPRFDIVTLVLNICPHLALVQDVRGSQALHYVRDEHWIQWCAYFFHQRDRYWPCKKTST